MRTSSAMNTLMWCSDPSPTSSLGFILCDVVSENATSITLRRVANPHDPSDDFTGGGDDWLDDMYGDDVIVRKKSGLGFDGVWESNEGDPAAVTDLITLRHLHPASLLHSLSARFHASKIYTMTGPILISLNPFTDAHAKALYGPDMKEAVKARGICREGGIEVQPGEPHAYEIADKCYRDMVRDRRSQSILIR